MIEYCFFLEIIFTLWIYLHWALYQEYLTIRNLNNLFALTELFPTPNLLDWRTHTHTHTHTHIYIYIYIYVCVCVCVYIPACKVVWFNLAITNVNMLRYAYVHIIFKLRFAHTCIQICIPGDIWPFRDIDQENPPYFNKTLFKISPTQ